MGFDTTTSAWTRLAAGPDSGLVLAFDFDMTSRGEAGFRDLVALMPGPVAMWHNVRPPNDLACDAYMSWWAEELEAADAEVAAVLGFCSGCGFAAEIAGRLGLRGRRPHLVLLDPGRPDRATLEKDFAAAISGLTPLTAHERARATAELASELTRFQHDFAAVAARTRDAYRTASRTAFDRVGVDPDVGAELVAVFDGYTRYLQAAQALPARPGWSPATTVTSARRTASPDFGGPHISTSFARRDLLRTPDIARLVSEVIQTGRGR